MKKIIAIVAGAAFALPMLASAATISNAVFSNGDTTIDAQGGSTVTGTFILQVGANETCEVLRTQADTQPFTDTQVGGTLGDQEGTYTNVPFSVKVPPNTGTYNATVQCAGIWGGNHSIDGADNVVVGPVSLGTIRVVANTSVDGSTSFGGMDLTSLIALLKSLGLTVGTGTSTPTPTKPACPPLYVGNNASFVQSWLLDNGYAASFNAAGVFNPTGHWGMISTNAYLNASNACK